jgi:hypothetical protein
MTLESEVQQGIFERIGSYIAGALGKRPAGDSSIRNDPQDSPVNPPSTKLPENGPFRTSAKEHQFIPSDTTDFCVEKDERYYWLHNVPHLGRKKTFGLTRQALDNEKQRLLEDWVAYTADKDDCLIASDEFFSIVDILEENRSLKDYSQRTLVDEIRAYLKGELAAGGYHITGTKVVHSPKGHGKIIQNLGSEDENEIFASNIIGESDYISNIRQSSALLSALYGTDNAKDICAGLEGLTGSAPKIYRPSKNPAEETVMPVVIRNGDCYITQNIGGRYWPGRALGVARYPKTQKR